RNAAAPHVTRHVPTSGWFSAAGSAVSRALRAVAARGTTMTRRLALRARPRWRSALRRASDSRLAWGSASRAASIASRGYGAPEAYVTRCSSTTCALRQVVEVREILEPAAGPLVLLQVLQADDVHRHPVPLVLDAVGPARFEVHPRSRGHQLDPLRRQPHTDDLVRSRERLHAQLRYVEAEVAEDRKSTRLNSSHVKIS